MQLIIAVTLLTCTTAMKAVVTARHVRPTNSTKVSQSPNFLEVARDSLRLANTTSEPEWQLQADPPPLGTIGAENQTNGENQTEAQQFILPSIEATSSPISSESSIDEQPTELIRGPSLGPSMDAWYQKMASGVLPLQPYYERHQGFPMEFQEPSTAQVDHSSAQYSHLLSEVSSVGSRSGVHPAAIQEETRQHLMNGVQWGPPVQMPYVQPYFAVPSVANNAFAYQRRPVVRGKWRNEESPWVASNRDFEDANVLPRHIQEALMANSRYSHQGSPEENADWLRRQKEASLVGSSIQLQQRNTPEAFKLQPHIGVPFVLNSGYFKQASRVEPLELLQQREASLVTSGSQLLEKSTLEALEMQSHKQESIEGNKSNSKQGSSIDAARSLQDSADPMGTNGNHSQRKIPLEVEKIHPLIEALVANKTLFHEESLAETVQWLERIEALLARQSENSLQQSEAGTPPNLSNLETQSVTTQDQSSENRTEVPILQALEERSAVAMKHQESPAQIPVFHQLDVAPFSVGRGLPQQGSTGDQTDILSEASLSWPSPTLNQGILAQPQLSKLTSSASRGVSSQRNPAQILTSTEIPLAMTNDHLPSKDPIEVSILQAPKKRSDAALKRRESHQLDDAQIFIDGGFPRQGSIRDQTDIVSKTSLNWPTPILNQGILVQPQLSEPTSSASREVSSQGSPVQISPSTEIPLAKTKDHLPSEDPTEVPILQALKKRSAAAMKLLQRSLKAQASLQFDAAQSFAGLPRQGSTGNRTDIFSKTPLDWLTPVLNQGIQAETTTQPNEQPSSTIGILNPGNPEQILTQLQVLKEGLKIANNISRESVSSIEAAPLVPRDDSSLVPTSTFLQEESPTEVPLQLQGEAPLTGMQTSTQQESQKEPQGLQPQKEVSKEVTTGQSLPGVISKPLPSEPRGQTAFNLSDSEPATSSEPPPMKRVNEELTVVVARNTRPKSTTGTTSQRLNDTRVANTTRRQSTSRNTTELPQVTIVNEVQAKELIEGFNDISRSLASRSSAVAWAFESDMSEENRKKMTTEKKAIAQKNQQIWRTLMKVDWKQFKDPDLKRRYFMSSILGTTALSSNESVVYTRTIRAMKEIYSRATVCYYNDSANCTLHLNPDLEEIFARSRNESELRYYWKAWRDASGRQMRKNYERYAEMKRAISNANGIADPVKMWNFYFEDPDFEQRVQDLWDEIKPLYDQLHAYARHKLFEFYGPDVMTKDGPIPAHLFGNMWGQSWINVKDLMMKDPFFEGYKGDIVTEELQKQGFTIIQIAKEAEKFFVSLGFPRLPEPFWTKSIFTRPPGIDLNCHPSSWNFYNNDVRVKMCSSVDEKNFITVHHEMGHCEYYLMYAHQPFVFQKGANQGFHEAIGDTVALNVQTPSHMEKIGLVNNTDQNVRKEVRNLAHLLHIALEKISFIPFGYLIDKYRWEVMQGNITSDRLNEAYWEMRERYQGLEPPVPRTEEDFDPGAKFHVAADSKYIIYFVSHILQFQLYKGLCQAAGQYDPSNQNVWLSECDVFGNQAAGEKFRAMMSMGASKPWPDALEVVTGTRELSERPFLEYFKPLYKWLKEYNTKNNVTVGWIRRNNVMMPSKLPST